MVPTNIIRPADARDALHVQRIYAPFVRDSPASFEVEPPLVEEMGRRIEDTLRQFPYLICERQGKVVGFAYASSHHARAAYIWSVNVSVYVDPQCHRCGVGTALYAVLFEILRMQGFYNAYAGVTLPNPASVGLHEALGFRPVGIYVEVGHKAGAWHDVGWWQMALQDRAANPARPLSMDEVRALPEWATVFGSG
jgi:L-amino acid N-acyltransferase YncA